MPDDKATRIVKRASDRGRARIEYVNAEGERSTRSLTAPVVKTSRDGNTVVVARDSKTDQPRQFRADRVRRVR